MSKNIKNKEHQQALLDFRKKHFAEMEKNIQVAISIRDNPNSLAKDKNEAMKLISRMLGSLVPEKIETKTKEPLTKKERELSPSEKAEMDSILNEN